MSLKLIREAHLASTLSAEEIKALSVIKDAVGKDSIASLMNEAFTPTADDFDAWMRVVVGEAQDRGINLNKRSEFMQLVMDILENDPANPPFDMQEAIAQKLWQDYKSAKNEVRIGKIAAAKEEEEKVEAARKQIADRFANGPASVQAQTTMHGAGEEEETVDDFVKGGGTIQRIKARGPRKGERWQGSAHIGKSNERPGRSTTGKAANTRGRPVIGLSKAGTEEEESGFAQAFNTAMGTEDEEQSSDAIRRGYDDYFKRRGNPYDPGTNEYSDWYVGRSEAEYERHGVPEEDEEESNDDDWGAEVRITGGPYTGEVGHISYDHDKKRWITIDMMGHHRDLDADTTPHEMTGDGIDVWHDANGRPNRRGAYDAGGHYDLERDMNNYYEDEEDSMSFLKDALRDTKSQGALSKGSFSSHLKSEEGFDEYEDADAAFDTDEYSVDDDEVFTSDDAECNCDGDDETFDDESFDDEDDMGPPEEEFDDDTMDDVDADISREAAPKKSYDEEEAVKSFFRQAATAPRNMMTQAIKDIEGEGKSAFTQSNVPKNPHPQKSAAYRAWQRGMLAAAKDALGIVDKAKDTKAKAKKKK